ncbi:unnamed protein product [Didymodactylos carnosus]|uniref:NAD(P)(+)--arginine ADP-ribosyltransferase n=1 Tax=Didymodactylos carnosus TaxID=1234261 RepID=A0A815XAJ4_9BILA|nr:unnamed protein product [Didymodactylos carnosus]CAF1555062.1 unnamed protein product [Didymodactylos carnosus]CAF4145653.1 unnamed protein product [Didymodactylos carnosus]CAF4416222.1 unnamed protein product [Didymodactylos carnosus]
MDSYKSLAYLNNIQKRYDTVYVIWLDEANDTHIEAKQNLNNIVQHTSIFTNADECITHISSLNEIAKVFLILSKYYAQIIIELERGGLSTFLSDDKIAGIFHDENRLFLKLTHDVARSSGNHPSSIPMIIMNSQEESRQNYLKVLELEQSRLSVSPTIIRHSIKVMSKQCGTYTWHQFLLTILLRMKNSDDAKMNMLNEYRLCYNDDIFEQRKIDDFDENYDLTKAVWWYTRDSFLYRELNKALRTEKIEQLFMFRYFISDLHTQLVQLHSDYVALLEEYDRDVIMVYRGQTITSDEFQKLEQNIGRFISMNTFISTTTDRNVAIIYAGDGSQSPDLESVLLEITIDIHIRTKPFANIREYSYFHDEDEILFSIGTLF